MGDFLANEPFAKEKQIIQLHCGNPVSQEYWFAIF